MLKREFVRAPAQCAALKQSAADSAWKGPRSQVEVQVEGVVDEAVQLG